MPTIKLTRRSIAAIRPDEKPVTYFDTDLHGFGLRVMPTGVRSWVVEYRPGAGGRRVAKRRVVLGRADDATPPEKAREAAATLLAKVRSGADPAAERSDERKAETVAEVMTAYLSRHVETKRKGSTAALYRMLNAKHIEAAIGTKVARAVTRSEVARLHRNIGASGKPTANRVLALLSGAYNWASANGVLPEGTNPARGVEKFAETSRERFLTTEEIQRLGAALLEAETVGITWQIEADKPTSKHVPKRNQRTVVSPHATAAIRLLMFTGARLREVLHLEWSQVDLERGILFLPDSKTGKKAVILSAPAMLVLKELPRLGRYVVASDSAGQKDERPRRDLKRPWEVVTRAAKLEGLRLHDLRHTFASVGAGAGLSLPQIGAMLGHADSKTTAKYAHLAVDPVRRAADLIANQIAEAMNGKRSSKETSDRQE